MAELPKCNLECLLFSKEELRKLNNGLWPLILEKVKEKITTDFQSTDIVVMEAALLIQANWTDHCHEIWSCIIPADEVNLSRFELYQYRVVSSNSCNYVYRL